MGYPTGIEWTDATWNVVGGCDIDSTGCKNCYAQEVAGLRLAHLPLYDGVTDIINGKHVFNGKLTILHDEHPAWRWPISWRGSKAPKMGPGKPSAIFVGDMADLFHEKRSGDHIDRVLNVIEEAQRHIFQVLTKRPQRMRQCLEQRVDRMYFSSLGADDLSSDEIADLESVGRQPLLNVWCGISAERQQEFDRRWPEMKATPAAVRFVSYEPMLGPLMLGYARPDWLIAGCESGNGMRSYDIAWVRSIRDQCQERGTAFFLKQLAPDGRIVSLPELDGRQWREFPAIDRVNARRRAIGLLMRAPV